MSYLKKDEIDIQVAEMERNFKEKHRDVESNAKYQLVFMSTLSNNSIPEKGKVYLEKDNNTLKYSVLSPSGELAEGVLEIYIQGKLTHKILSDLKYFILEETSKRGHAYKSYISEIEKHKNHSRNQLDITDPYERVSSKEVRNQVNEHIEKYGLTRSENIKTQKKLH